MPVQLPLSGIRILDFSTLLPGPLATLILAEAGADVVKIEAPKGDDTRGGLFSKHGAEMSVNFALLNHGKRSIAVDLKDDVQRTALEPLIREADVLVEQFRPGVMARLGLGYDAVRALNPRIVYCSITGYGQTGPKAARAGHDLNYMAEMGMTALAGDAAGNPVIAPALVADVGGGTYPAVINILLALRQRDATGVGCHLDIGMADNVLPFAFWAFGDAVAGIPPAPGKGLLSGGSPRYSIYRTADGRHLAVGALEQKFWLTVCRIAGLPETLWDDARDPQATQAALADCIARGTAETWRARFAEVDACVSVVDDLSAGMRDPQAQARGLFASSVELGAGAGAVPALPLPVVPALRKNTKIRYAPQLGEGNAELLGPDGSLSSVQD